MKILQIVTYISPDGAYGGPVRVAINQSKALRDLGHDVVVAGASGGFSGRLPKMYDGFPVRLFPSRRLVPRSGFAGLSSPQLMWWLVTAMRNVDVVHVHLARDLVTLPAAALALLLKKRLVVQTHGMIDETGKWLARPLDIFLTRPVLRNAESCLYLIEDERRDLVRVAHRDLSLHKVINGAIFELSDTPGADQTIKSRPQVLFLARLHAIKRPLIFVETARRLIEGGCNANFHLVGPDEGEASKVQDAIQSAGLSSRVFYEGSVDPEATSSRLSECDVYVLPSLDETFPMSVIEALAVGKPVVLSSTCGLASIIRDGRAGIVADGSTEGFANAVNRILGDSALRHAMGRNGKLLAQNEFSISSVASKLVQIYSNA
ncbi:glycosyltransferase [Kocuria rosea]|uniref:glycosyltransferase n=1 Tax=Kocuria rosea TaxID=1275 RepID=UPI000D64C570|nr:glycosyltransferase [Kocuria rosea]PWF79893.1 glycosyltransferase [Kocuria rosea]STX15463.1 D-inositol-3-phosphate glycosyltransferase [Kocuria rosea]